MEEQKKRPQNPIPSAPQKKEKKNVAPKTTMEKKNIPKNY
jgi:hypothetical protein